MTKQFVTYEIAKELKSLGFNEKCLAMYILKYNKKDSNGEWVSVPEDKIWLEVGLMNGQNTISLCAPLWQQALDWLREKHKYSVSIHVDEDNSTPSNIKYWYCIDSFFEVPNNKIVREGIEEVDNFNSYQEAREQAILKTIELIKNK